MSYVAPTGLGWSTGGANPLTGAALAPNQTVVTGPLATGPRQTVVTLGRQDTWPRWITSGPDGFPVDSGTVAGGTWDGTGGQSLPEIMTVGQVGMPSWVWVALALGALWLLTSGRKGRSEW